MKKIRLGVMALLVLLFLSATGSLFSFIYVSFKDLSRQNRQKMFRDFERQEKESQILEKEYRDWQKLPDVLKKFRKENILNMDKFAVFRRDLDSCLAANQLQPSRIDFTFSNLQDNIKKASVKFSLDGSYRSLKKFIFDMEAKSKMYFFENLELSSSAATVKGAFTMGVYIGE